MRGLRFLFVGLLVAWLLLLVGCGLPVKDNPYEAEGGAAGSSTTVSTGDGGSSTTSGDLFTTTSSTDGEGGGPVCADVCKEYKPAWFEELSMFWIGSPNEAPPCPDVAPLEGSIGYADFVVSEHTCPECMCSPAECALPEDMHVSAAKCPGNGAPSIAWESPAWDGTCTAEGAIAPGLMCGGVPCSQSLTTAAISVEPCKPSQDGAAVKPDPSWGMMARECLIGPLSGEGCATGEACAPAPPEGFSLCVYRYGDDPVFACPENYPRRYVVYAGIQDDRSCEPCACSDPQGADCSALVSAYTDGGCSSTAAAAIVTTDEPACVDLPSGAGLASKAATWLVQTSGSCTASGGQPMGAIAPAGPVTLCCEPQPAPAE